MAKVITVKHCANCPCCNITTEDTASCNMTECWTDSEKEYSLLATSKQELDNMEIPNWCPLRGEDTILKIEE